MVERLHPQAEHFSKGLKFVTQEILSKNLRKESNNLTKSDYSIFELAQKKLRLLAEQNKFLAECSVSITSTLESVYQNKDRDLHYDLKLLILNRKKDNLIRLALISYEVPKVLSCYLKLQLEEICAQRLELQDVKFILSSEVNKNIWLRNHVESLNPNQVFGNFLNIKDWNETLTKSFKIKRIRNHKRPTDFKPEKRTIGVGYKDKGTLPKSTSPGSLKQLSLANVQREIEQNRQAADDLYKVLEGFFW